MCTYKEVMYSRQVYGNKNGNSIVRNDVVQNDPPPDYGDFPNRRKEKVSFRFFNSILFL